jgi:hypothetical protein
MERSNDKSSRIPENDPSKAMDSKREVEQSNDERTDEDFPGYPHYPAKEDIMDQRTDSHRVDMDVENLPNGSNVTGVSQRYYSSQERENILRAEQSATADNLETFDTDNAEIGTPQNVSNEDIESGKDLPGSDLDQETKSGK